MVPHDTPLLHHVDYLAAEAEREGDTAGVTAIGVGFAIQCLQSPRKLMRNGYTSKLLPQVISTLLNRLLILLIDHSHEEVGPHEVNHFICHVVFLFRF